MVRQGFRGRIAPLCPAAEQPDCSRRPSGAPAHEVRLWDGSRIVNPDALGRRSSDAPRCAASCSPRVSSVSRPASSARSRSRAISTTRLHPAQASPSWPSAGGRLTPPGPRPRSGCWVGLWPPPEEANLRGRVHSLGRDKAAIAHHYDLSNEFYALFLGPSMTYSCARFTHPDSTLEEAQAAKYELVCRKLGLRPGMRLLDVGCGWGGMVIHAPTHHGVDTVGVTISGQQYENPVKRVTRRDS